MVGRSADGRMSRDGACSICLSHCAVMSVEKEEEEMVVVVVVVVVSH